MLHTTICTENLFKTPSMVLDFKNSGEFSDRFSEPIRALRQVVGIQALVGFRIDTLSLQCDKTGCVSV